MNRLVKIIIINILALYSIAAFAGAQCQQNNILVLSDIHLDAAATNTMDISPTGYNSHNDLDANTFQQLMSKMASGIKNNTISKPCSVLVLGDVVGHTRTKSNSAETSEAAVFKSLSQTFPNTPILYAPGNNDSLKINYGPFTDATSQNSVKSAYDVATIEAGWKDGFLSTGIKCSSKNKYPCLIKENKKFGYYDVYLDKGLRIIALNTVLFSPWRSSMSQQDAIDELNWLDAELNNAKTKKEHVILAMHIPPGNTLYDGKDDWLSKEESIFLSKIKTYHPIIIAMLASHTHMDEVKVLKDNQNNIVGAIYYTGGLSTSHGNSPSVKTFYLGEQNNVWGITDYQSYYFHNVNSVLTIDRLYDYQNYYCNGATVNNLSACLANIDAGKIKKYFSAGNANFAGTIGSPSDYVLVVH